MMRFLYFHVFVFCLSLWFVRHQLANLAVLFCDLFALLWRVCVLIRNSSNIFVLFDDAFPIFAVFAFCLWSCFVCHQTASRVVLFDDLFALLWPVCVSFRELFHVFVFCSNQPERLFCFSHHFSELFCSTLQRCSGHTMVSKPSFQFFPDLKDLPT